MLIKNTDQQTLQGKVREHVVFGSMLYTNKHRGYIGLDGNLYNHQAVKRSAKEYVRGMAHTNGIESVWAVLKRGINGTFYNISVKHLRRYVDEFTFRLNEGNVKRYVLDKLDSVLTSSIDKESPYKVSTR